MKILQVHNYYRFRGGEDRYVDILQQVLRQNGYHVIPFFYDSRDIEHFNLIQRGMIPFRLIRSHTAGRKLEKLILEEKPDLAVVHNLFPLLSLTILNVLKRNNIPVLKRLENYKFLCLNGLFLRNNFKVCEKCKHGNFIPGIIHRCYQRSFINSLGIAIPEFIHRKMKTVLKKSDLFLASSHFVKSKFVESGFPGGKIIVHPNFLDFEPLEAAEPPGDYVIYLGRLFPEKGLITLLKAFKELPETRLKIVGDGPMERELKEYVNSNRMENVVFEGFVDGKSKLDLLKKAMFMVFPSECYESFGNTIVESYACGVPVLVVGVGAAAELVQEGKTGYLFEQGNVEDLKEKVFKMVSEKDKTQGMRHYVLERAKELYTKETGYKNLEAIFDTLLKGENEILF
jgi:glycosyltransferase involved in cell wall biosynthesis